MARPPEVSGNPAASASAARSILIGLALVVAGYALLARIGRQPAWHHHLARPLGASLAMVPVCLLLERWHVLSAVLGGALTYVIALTALGGLRRADLRALLSRDRPGPAADCRITRTGLVGKT